MRTSTTILEKIERLLTHRGWAYYAMWHFPPMAPPRALPRPDARSGRETEVRR